jgi:alpha-galactosidase
MAWQFDRPDQGEGMVQTFRRKDSTDESITIKLQGLKTNTTYSITNLDELGTHQMTGRELMYTGLKVTCKPTTAMVFVYKKQ